MEIEGLDKLMVAKGETEDNRSGIENSASSIDREELKLLSSIGDELGSVTGADALTIVSMALSLKSTVKDREFSSQEQQIIKFARSLNKVGIFVSNIREDALIGGQDESNKTDKLNSKSDIKGTLVSLESSFDPISGKWIFKAKQKICPFQQEMTNKFLRDNFKRGEVVKKQVLPYPNQKDRPFLSNSRLSKRQLGPLLDITSHKPSSTERVKGGLLINGSFRWGDERGPIKSQPKQEKLNTRFRNEKGAIRVRSNPKSEPSVNRVGLDTRLTYDTFNQPSVDHSPKSERRVVSLSQRTDLKSIVIGESLSKAFKEADEWGTSIPQSKRKHTIKLNLNSQLHPKNSESQPLNSPSEANTRNILPKVGEGDKKVILPQVEGGLKDSQKEAGLFKHHLLTKEDENLSDNQGKNPIRERLTTFSPQVSVKNERETKVNDDFGKENNFFIFHSETQNHQVFSMSENKSFMSEEKSGSLTSESEISADGQMDKEIVGKEELKEKGSSSKDKKGQDVNINGEVENSVDLNLKIQDESAKNDVEIAQEINWQNQPERISTDAEKVEEEVKEEEKALGTNERIDRSDTSGIVIHQTITQQVSQDIRQGEKHSFYKPTIQTTLHLALEPDSNDNFPSSDQVKVKDFISSVLNQIEKSVPDLDQAA